MIVEFDQEKSTVTFGGGRFVCFFIHHGIINKTLEFRIFEANENFQPLDKKHPLFTENVPFDERKILTATKLIVDLDSGKAPWIPERYFLNDKNAKEVQNLEEQAAQMAFGKAILLLKGKKYEAALFNITSSLLSEYLRNNPKYHARFLREQAEAYVGLDKYGEAKNALVRAREVFEEDSSFEDYFALGYADYKIGNKEGSRDNLLRFIESARAVLKNSGNQVKNSELISMIEMSTKLIEKIGH
jgi:hypothetical protein